MGIQIVEFLHMHSKPLGGWRGLGTTKTIFCAFGGDGGLADLAPGHIRVEQRCALLRNARRGIRNKTKGGRENLQLGISFWRRPM